MSLGQTQPDRRNSYNKQLWQAREKEMSKIAPPPGPALGNWKKLPPVSPPMAFHFGPAKPTPNVMGKPAKPV